MKKLVLAIETSCDETGLALVEASGGLSAPKFRVLKNLISSQIKIHRPFGGVVPMLAKREHLKNLPILYRQIFSEKGAKAKAKKVRIKNIDLITVTVGPGLEPALWTGITFAKELARIHKKPLIGANHMEGHLYSFLLSSQKKTAISKQITFPAIALIVSGGHTILLRMDSLTEWKKLGETRDDAAGEAFDKVARLLKFPYPGGPEIEKLAKKGNSGAIAFPRPMMNTKDYDFSFSGLKTSVLYYLRDHKNISKADVAASFQQAVVDVLVSKTMRAAREFSAQGGSASGGGATKSIILCGGVAANKALRQKLKVESSKLKVSFLVPEFSYNTDNAAMIAAAGYFTYLKKKKLPLVANGDLGI